MESNKILVENFAEFAKENVKRFLYSEAHMYDEDLFLGGISDVCAEMKDGSYAIMDFKSSKEAYFGHFIQVAIYHLLVEKNGLFDADGNFLFQIDKPISKYFIIPFGAKEFTIHENANVEELKKAAKACIEIYRAKAQFEGK